MSNEKNSQNKSGELKKPPYVTRTNQPWTTVFAEDLNKKKEEDTPAETKLDLSQFVKVEKVQDDKSTTIPAPVSEAEKDKADTVNKGNVQNVTPIPTPEHKFRPKGSSQQSKPSDEFETKPVMEAAPAATEEKPVAKPESNQQDDDSDSFVSPSFGGFKNPYADEELEEKPEKKPEAKDTEKKTVKPKVAVKSHKGGNVILGVSCVVLAASVVVMGMTIAESRKSDSIVYPSTGSALNISADVATTDTNFENQEALTPVVSMTSDGNTWTLSSSTFLITDGESKVAVAVDSADSIKYDGAALQYERNGVTYLVRMVSDSSYLGNSTMTEHEDGATHMITGIEGIGNGKVLVVIATYGATGDESMMPIDSTDSDDSINEELFKDLPTATDISMDPVTAYEAITGVSKADATETECMTELFRKQMKLCSEACGQGFRYVESPLVRAIRNGWVCELQEPSLITRPSVMPGLNGLLDETGCVVLPTGEMLHRHPDCIIISTLNVDLEGCRPLNQSFIDRHHLIVDMKCPNDAVIIKRIKGMTGCGNDVPLQTMVDCVHQIAKKCQTCGATDGNVNSMRSLANWVQAGMLIGDYAKAAEWTVVSGATSDPQTREELMGVVANYSFA